ncbi:MAG: SAM-dependent methyltransferase [Clostridia bacterium]|nr:SAM-dependent methyltransferase [Clostridia bacterium]
MKKCAVPDERLRSAADFVRQGAVLADIGTDHAILPVFLCECGKVERAYATDVAKGPLEFARRHVEEKGLASQITLVRTDGLEGLEDKGITDITVCGMGGELIASILQRAQFIKDKGVRLVLQPMTRHAALRSFLAENGFAIQEERAIEAQGKCYFCLCCHYTGEKKTLSRLEAELGEGLYQKEHTPAFLRYVEAKCASQQKKIENMKQTPRLSDEVEAETAYAQGLFAFWQAIKKEQ